MQNLDQAILELEDEGIVAIPTETVYGLAGNAFSEKAVSEIFKIKRRPSHNPLIVHIKSIDYLDQVAMYVPEAAYKLAEAFWPGPLTLVLSRKQTIPDAVTSGLDTVGVRIPDHPLTLELLDKLEFPLAAPSANPFGSISPTCAAHVRTYFSNKIPVLDGGACTKGIESTIIGFDENIQPVLYRYGTISLEEIEKVVGRVKIITKEEIKPSAPGMLSRHYAPDTETYLTNNVSETLSLFSHKKIGLLLFKERIERTQAIHQEILSKTGCFKEAAKNLYASLHRLDRAGLELIIAERLPEIGIGVAINDKLKRATKK